jgi:hypothetical protein
MKIILAALIIIGICPAVGALEIHIAPVLYVDEVAGERKDSGRVQRDLMNYLGKIETGYQLGFKAVGGGRINPPESLLDAITVSRDEKADYLLYGYVTRSSYTFQAEIRLLDYEGRQIKQNFYGMDDPEHYERLIADISQKILSYLGDVFNVRIYVEKPSFTRILTPAAVGYWTPMSSDWTRYLIGTVNISAGFSIIPSDNCFVIKGKSFYFSTGLDAAYRLGVGNPDSYESFDHSLYLILPVNLHMVLAERHHIFTGLGFIYFLDFFNITQKYTDSNTFIYNNMGLHIDFGYQFFLKENLIFCVKNNFDFQFADKSLISYSPGFGLSFMIYEREIKKKW